ncbi:MAG: aminotransferase [Pseudomonadota bacterium]|nr:aminotransferase [Pseudomonadota bacterium]
MPALNPLLTGIELPPIPQAHAWAARYDGAHGPALDLCQAVPGWAPHAGLLRALAAAAGDPSRARYGLIDGDVDLRETYAAEMSAVYGGGVGADEVAITAGCNQAFFLAMVAIAQAGDAVLLPVPWFWNHQQSCTMLGIEPRPLPCRADDGFVPDPAAAEALIASSSGDRVRAIVLISPNNPTGAVYPPAVIEAFFKLCQRRGIWLILDETYRDFLPAGQDRAHGLFARADWAETLIQLYSFSKAYCVPGARMGAITAGSALVREFVKALDCLHICPQRPAQAAIGWGIEALGEWRAANRAVINERAAVVRAAFETVPEWGLESLGAYFAYVRHPFAQPAAAVAERLAAEFGAVCLPGPAFGPGQEQHVRMAFANTDRAGLGELASRLGRMMFQR